MRKLCLISLGFVFAVSAGAMAQTAPATDQGQSDTMTPTVISQTPKTNGGYNHNMGASDGSVPAWGSGAIKGWNEMTPQERADVDPASR